MAIKPIEEMTRPVSRGEETQMAMSDAPEDYLKRAVEQFIIEFPEFEEIISFFQYISPILEDSENTIGIEKKSKGIKNKKGFMINFFWF